MIREGSWKKAESHWAQTGLTHLLLYILSPQSFVFPCSDCYSLSCATSSVPPSASLWCPHCSAVWWCCIFNKPAKSAYIHGDLGLYYILSVSQVTRQSISKASSKNRDAALCELKGMGTCLVVSESEYFILILLWSNPAIWCSFQVRTRTAPVPLVDTLNTALILFSSHMITAYLLC